MPTTYTRTATSKDRRNIKQGKNRKEPRCETGNRSSQKPPSIIANSFHQLKLIPKPGIAVDAKLNSKNISRNDDYEKMYADLLYILHNACKLIGKPTSFDPLASGLDISVSLYYVLNSFKTNLVPDKYDVNIDHDEELGYYFTIFKYCDFEGYWHAFEAMPLIAAAKKSTGLLQIVLEVLNCLISKANISPWYINGIGYADYVLRDQLEDWSGQEFDSEEESEEAYNKAIMCLHNYECGEAASIRKMIAKSKYVKPEKILEKIQALKSKNKIIHWLKEACVFLQSDGCMDDFIYSEENDQDGMKFTEQVSIVWDFHDVLTSLQGECLDSEANGMGLNEPVICFPITKFTKKIDFSEIEERSKWPKKLSKLFQSHQDMLELINTKKK